MDSDSKEPETQFGQNENELKKTSSSSSQIPQKAKNAFKNIKGSFDRAKEKLMQNIGKADKSRDEVMEEYVEMFQAQKKMAHKLQEMMKIYEHCSKSSQGAFKDLCEAMIIMYGQDWVEHDNFENLLHNMNNLKQVYNKRLSEEIMKAVNKYDGQFDQVAHKVNRMEKKLVDYDASRHSLEHLQNSKGEDFAKFEKAHSRVKEAWKDFEPLQNELIMELPAICDSRIKFFTDDIKTFFEAESSYSEEASKHYQKLSKILADLDNEVKSGRYEIARRQPELIAPPEVTEEFAGMPKLAGTLEEHPIAIV